MTIERIPKRATYSHTDEQGHLVYVGKTKEYVVKADAVYVHNRLTR